MYTRSYERREPFRLPPRYSGSAFSPQKEEPCSPPPPLGNLLQPLAPLFGNSILPGTQGFDELLLLGLIFLLIGSEGGRDLVPILALLLFCNP